MSARRSVHPPGLPDSRLEQQFREGLASVRKELSDLFSRRLDELQVDLQSQLDEKVQTIRAGLPAGLPLSRPAEAPGNLPRETRGTLGLRSFRFSRNYVYLTAIIVIFMLGFLAGQRWRANQHNPADITTDQASTGQSPPPAVATTTAPALTSIQKAAEDLTAMAGLWVAAFMRGEVHTYLQQTILENGQRLSEVIEGRPKGVLAGRNAAADERIVGGVIQTFLNSQVQGPKLDVNGLIIWNTAGHPNSESAREFERYLNEQYLPSKGVERPASGTALDSLRRTSFNPSTGLLLTLQRAVAYEKVLGRRR
jgi:hypothetical protein